MTYYIAGLPYSAELYHYGILGQKWGIRRFQNKDGTRTDAGKKRYNNYSESSRDNANHNSERLKKAAKIAAITAGTALAGYGAYKLAKSGSLNKLSEAAGNAKRTMETKAAMKKTQRSLDSAVNNYYEQRRKIARKENEKRMRDAMDVAAIKDDELLEMVGRLENEAKFRRLVLESMDYQSDPRKKILVDAGKKVAGTFLAGAGTYAIKSILSKNFDPKEAAGYVAPKPKNK